MTDEGGIFQIGGRSAKVLAGEAVFVLPGQLHTAVALEEMPCQYVSVVFHPSLFTDGEKGSSLLWKKICGARLGGKNPSSLSYFEELGDGESAFKGFVSDSHSVSEKRSRRRIAGESGSPSDLVPALEVRRNKYGCGLYTERKESF